MPQRDPAAFTPPPVRRWAPKNLAVVYVKRSRVYLGEWGSAKAAAAYDALVRRLRAEHDRDRACPRPLPPKPRRARAASGRPRNLIETVLADDAAAAADVAELGRRYIAHTAATFEVDRRSKGIMPAIRRAWNLLGEWAGLGRLPPHRFSPRHLCAFRAWLAGDTQGPGGTSRWSLKTINEYIVAIVRGFRWAVTRELVHESVWRALTAVEPLRRGRRVEGLVRAPRPPRRREPATREQIRAVRRRLPLLVRAMLDVQLLSGARPNEVCEMRHEDLLAPRRGVVLYRVRPEANKTEWQGIDRVIPLGPRAQRVLRIVAARIGGEPRGYVFSPREGERLRNECRRESRRLKRWPSHAPEVRRGRRLAAGGGEAPGPADRYSPDSYRRAIERACDAAGVDRFTPYRLRHTAATLITGRESLEVAMHVLGHADTATTLRYARLSERKAAASAARYG